MQGSEISPSVSRPSTLSEGSSAVVQCGVCQQNQGRYTCPKCETPYCSVSCYQNHCEIENSSQGCSESFYHDRVSQVLQLELRAKQQDTQRMLSRNYAQHQEDQLVHSDLPSEATEEELHTILATLEGGDEQELARLLSSSRLKTAFERAIETGNLHDWFLKPWHPWWRKEIIVEANGDEDKYDGGGLEESGRGKKTLDQLLLEVPSFRSIQPTGRDLPDLSFNLVSIMYGISWMLRLYYGVENAKEVGVDAVNTLVQASPVLGDDARFGTLEEALTASTVASTQSYQLDDGCNTHWSTMTQDIALMCRNRRLVGRALLEAIAVVRHELSIVKKSGDATGAAKMRRLRKKLEFYLAWSLEQSAMLAGVSEDIEVWTHDWKLSSDADGAAMLLPEEIVHTLDMGDASRQQAASKEPTSLLTEVSSHRKTKS